MAQIIYIPTKLFSFKSLYQNIEVKKEVIGLRLDGEENFFGENIDTPEEFVEDLCERVNTVYSTVIEDDDKIDQLAYLIGFLIALKGRLNRVCENI